ncbi:MAG: Hsp20/alpha crystallin family protein [Chloroflexota bacterium]|nr:MAG: hypothetical protein DIU68_10880 [Chloroflexota bacterium]
MTVVRWSPFRELAAMQNMVDRLFYDTLRETVREVQDDDQTLGVDIHESPTGYTIMANLPGVNPDDIEIRYENQILTISAEIPKQEVGNGAKALLIERPTGQFTRRLQIPRNIDFNAADARYENGVLTLTLPLHPEAQPKILTVRTANGAKEPEPVQS